MKCLILIKCNVNVALKHTKYGPKIKHNMEEKFEIQKIKSK